MNNTYGVSNVIGALMLTLVVISSVTAFAVFTQQKQDEIQKSELAKLERSLEDLTIISMKKPVYDGTPLKLENVTFVIANLHTKDIKISTLRINNYLLLNFIIQRIDMSKESWKINTSTGKYDLEKIYYETTGWINTTDKKDLKMLSREQITLSLKNISKDILKPVAEEIYINDAITFEIITVLTNTFSKTFIPPTSIIKINYELLWDSNLKPPNYNNFEIFDGSASDAPSEGYIISWDWKITPIGTYALNATGEAYIFEDKNKDTLYNDNETVLDFDFDQNGVDAVPEDGNQGGIFARDSQSISEPFVFIDNNHDFKYNTGEIIIDYDPDQNNITAIPANNDLAQFTTTGRKAMAKFITININHLITLTVTDNFGMSGTDSITYFK